MSDGNQIEPVEEFEDTEKRNIRKIREKLVSLLAQLSLFWFAIRGAWPRIRGGILTLAAIAGIMRTIIAISNFVDARADPTLIPVSTAPRFTATQISAVVTVATFTPTTASTATAPTATETQPPTVEPTIIQTLPNTTTPSATGENESVSVAISEVMFDACGPLKDDDLEEYVELFNFGPVSVSLEGYWLSDGRPQRIVPWLEVHYFEGKISAVDRDHQSSWLLPPMKFALILTYAYLLGDTPYSIPPDTYLFTNDPKTGYRLGGATGFVGSDDDIVDRSVLILYKGTLTSIEQEIDTYGTPRQTTDPWVVVDDGMDAIPLFQDDCYSVERRILSLEDTFLNWERIKGGSPGTTPSPTAMDTAVR